MGKLKTRRHGGRRAVTVGLAEGVDPVATSFQLVESGTAHGTGVVSAPARTKQ
jgi:hypothetical protein